MQTNRCLNSASKINLSTYVASAAVFPNSSCYVVVDSIIVCCCFNGLWGPVYASCFVVQFLELFLVLQFLLGKKELNVLQCNLCKTATEK